MKEKKKISRKTLTAAIVIVVIAVIALVLKGCSGPGKGASDTENQTATAQTMNIERTVDADGEITSSLEENIKPHTAYYLEEICVATGDAVKKGETILTYTNGYELEAPYNCVVETWYLPEVEEQLTTEHYVTIAGTDVMKIELTVGEDDVALVSKGDEASVTVEAVGKTYTGEVSHVSQVGNYSGGTSTFSADVVFDNNGDLKLGMNGSASIILEKATNVIGVPSSAVHMNGNSYYVTVQNGSETEEVAVETGVKNDSYVEIKSGLSEGATVVIPASGSSSNRDFGGMPSGGDMPGGMPSGMPDGGNMPGGGGPSGDRSK